MKKPTVHVVTDERGKQTFVAYCPTCDHPLNDDGTECHWCGWEDGPPVLSFGCLLAAIVTIMVAWGVIGATR